MSRAESEISQPVSEYQEAGQHYFRHQELSMLRTSLSESIKPSSKYGFGALLKW
jgi:hypothetical protein